MLTHEPIVDDMAQGMHITPSPEYRNLMRVTVYISSNHNKIMDDDVERWIEALKPVAYNNRRTGDYTTLRIPSVSHILEFFGVNRGDKFTAHNLAAIRKMMLAMEYEGNVKHLHKPEIHCMKNQMDVLRRKLEEYEVKKSVKKSF